MPKPSSNLDILKAIGCLSLATVTSTLSGEDLTALSPALTVVNGLLKDVSVNLASDQIGKLNLARIPKGLGPDITNHDLQKALKTSVIDALRATHDQYATTLKPDKDPSHLKAISDRIQELCEEVEETFVDGFFADITDKDILNYQEGHYPGLGEALIKAIEPERFEHHGPAFLQYMAEMLPYNLRAAFTEILKTDIRVRVPYQRIYLRTIKEGQTETNEKLVELINKVELIESNLNQKQEGFNILIKAMPEIWQFLERQKGVIETALPELKSFVSASEGRILEAINNLSQIDSDGKHERKEIKEGVQEVLAFSIEIRELLAQLSLGQVQSKKIEALPAHISQTYLDQIIKDFSYIDLPRLELNRPPKRLPLDNVYVALQLVTERENIAFKDGARYLQRQIERKVSVKAPKADVTAEVLRENATIKAFSEKKLKNSDTAYHLWSEGVVSLDNIFRNHRKIVILGHPGSGKSTIIKWLSLALSKSTSGQVLVPRHCVHGGGDQDKQVSLGPRRVPIVIKVPEYAKFYSEFTYREGGQLSGRKLIDYLGLHLPELPNVSRAKFRRFLIEQLRQRNCVVFLDGLDEIVESRQNILREIDDFIASWIEEPDDATPELAGGNQIVITSRIVGFTLADLKSETTKVYVRDMDRGAIERFCSLWVRADGQQDSSPLVEAILSSRVRQLATKPLLVTILALLFERDQSLPASRVLLYKRCIDALTAKWRSLHHSISPDNVDQLLEEIAHHIHNSPSEVITEAEMRDLLERVVAEEKMNRTGSTVRETVELFLNVLKKDVGLLTEKGHQLYHFLHRTFQEYLAARRLIRNDKTAANKIIERISDPVWREPVLLALEFANLQYSTGRFEVLVRELLRADDHLKGLIPRSIILIARLLPNLQKISRSLFEELLLEILQVYGNQDGIGQFPEVRQQLEVIIEEIRSSQRASIFWELIDNLVQQASREEAYWGLLVMAGKLHWPVAHWATPLLSQLTNDHADWDWPIDLLLRQIFAVKETLAPGYILPMRKMLKEESPQLDLIRSDPGWERLLASLCGGYPYNQGVATFLEYQETQTRLRMLEYQDKKEELDAAIKLDALSPQIENLLSGDLTWSPRFIHRESPLSLHLQRWLFSGYSSVAVQALLKNEWENTAADDEHRAQALLGLAAAGGNVEPVIYECMSHPLHNAAINRFLQHLDRLENGLSLAYIRFNHQVGQSENLSTWGLGNLDVTTLNDVLLQAVEAANIHGLRPPYYLAASRPTNLFPDELAEARKNSEAFVQRDADGMLQMLGSQYDDVSYDLAVMMDLTEKLYQADQGIYYTKILANLRNAPSLNTRFVYPWRGIPFAFRPRDQRDLLVEAIRSLEGTDPKIDHFKTFSAGVLYDGMEGQPGLQMALLISMQELEHDSHLNAFIRKLDEKYYLHYAVETRLDTVKDAFVRFLIAAYLQIKTNSTVGAEALMPAFDEIRDPIDKIRAFFFLLEYPQLLYSEKDWTQKIRALLKQTSAIHFVEQYARQIPDPFNQFIGYLYTAELATGEIEQKLIEHCASLIPRMDNDSDRREALTLLLRYFRNTAGQLAPSLWKTINASFQDPTIRQRALGKDYQWLAGLLSKREETGDPSISSQPLNVLCLLRMTQQLRYRFITQKNEQVLIDNILNGEQPEACLRELINQSAEGIALNEGHIKLIDHFVSTGRNDFLRSLLPVLRLKSSRQLQQIRSWEKSPAPELRQFHVLLLKETGHLDAKRFRELIPLLKSKNDFLRYRATIAIRGARPIGGNRNRSLKTSELGLDFLQEVRNIQNSEGRDDPRVGSPFRWLTHQLQHNDYTLIEPIANLLRSKDKEELELGKFLIETIENATPPFVYNLFQQLEQEEATVGRLLWHSIARMVYSGGNNNTYGERMVRQDWLASAVDNDVVWQGLVLLGNNIARTRPQSVTAALLDLDFSSSTSIQHLAEEFYTLERKYRQIDFLPHREDLARIRQLLWEYGSFNYASIDKELAKRDLLAEELQYEPRVVQLLEYLYHEKVELELVEDVSREENYSWPIINLLAGICRLRPEYVKSTVDEDRLVASLSKIVRYHTNWGTRTAAIELLLNLDLLNETTLSAIIGAVQDNLIVNRMVMENLPRISKAVDGGILDRIVKQIGTQGAATDWALTQLLVNLATQSALDVTIRERTIRTLADALRRLIKDPLANRFYYTLIHITDDRSNARAIALSNDLRANLYAQLTRLASI